MRKGEHAGGSLEGSGGFYAGRKAIPLLRGLGEVREVLWYRDADGATQVVET